MKLLFDENRSPILVKRLAELYPDSNHVHKLGIDCNSDEELRDYARREGFNNRYQGLRLQRPLHFVRLSTEGGLDTSRKLQHLEPRRNS